jgi:hypothetical protein
MADGHGALTHARLFWVTIRRTGEMLVRQRLGRFVPFFVVLLLGAALMWAVNAVAPVAPFVYSLF